MIYLKRKIPTLTALGVLLILGAVTLLTGCSKSNDTMTNTSQDKIHITATTTMLADLARQIGDDTVLVEGLMGPGIDPHLYQASAGDVTKLQEADVVLYNGLHLEGKMGEVFSALEDQDKTVICIENGLDVSSLLRSEDDESLPDPHIWFDVSIWKEAASYVAQELSFAYPENQGLYKERLSAYLKELDELDHYIKDRIQELPTEQRVLVTAHDAFQYFGRGYGFEVKGLQGISTDAEAGTADVMSLAQFIAEHQIKAIFIESSVPPKTIEALQAAVSARDFEVEIGGELYSDSLGDEDSNAETYILTFKTNIDTIVDALK